MSKGVVAASTGAGLVGVSGAGLYFMGVFDGKESHLPNSFQKFSEIGNAHCVEGYFPGLIFPSQQQGNKGKHNFSGREIASSPDVKVETSFLGHISQYIQPKSCLIVNWNKENYSGSKWKGNFRGLWSFFQGDRGFVMFTLAETNESESQMDLFGGVYFVKRDSKQWVIHKYKEINSSTIQSSDFDKKFPEVGDGIEKSRFGSKSDKWGFMSNKSDLANICKKSDADNCKEDQLSSQDGFRGRWEGMLVDAGQKTPSNWSKDGDKGASNIYKDVDNLKQVLNGGFQDLKGEWEVKFLDGSKVK